MLLARITSLALTLVLMLVLIAPVTEAAVNVALNRQLSLAQALAITCGNNPPEEYYPASELYKAPSDRTAQTCLNTEMHHPRFMVDGDLSTGWQTSSSVYINRGSASVTIDLAAIYEVEKLEIKFGDSKRPKLILLEKSTDGITFQKWVARVTKLSDCVNKFRVPVNFAPKTIDDVVCAAFANEVVPPSFETVKFDFNDIHGNLGRFRNARIIRITMSSLYTPLGINGYKFYHINIQELIVMSECMCFGHQIGCSDQSGTYTCECGMNTQGTYCEECKPFYNQRLIQDDEPCEACNCFQHADTCSYDLHLDQFNLSINALGVRKGGGRCINCQHNTTGVNCEKCISKYFRPASVVQTQVDACRPCDCNLPGCVINPENGLLGDCLMNNDVAPPVLGMLPGDCYCKTNVMGTRCDTCKPGFYNLLESNALGCQDCGCMVAGTVAGSAICAKDPTGTCPCKPFVSGRTCNQCKDQYYGLQAANTNGCLACACDPGGSFDNICHKETGQCTCRPNVEGRTCNAPRAGYYYPNPYYISAEFEQLDQWGKWERTETGYLGFGYWLATATTPGNAMLTVPLGATFSGLYNLLIRYRSRGLALGQISIQPATGVGEVIQADSITLSLCISGSTWCVYKVADKQFTLTAGRPYLVGVILNSGEARLDAVVAMPVEYTDATMLTSVLGASGASSFQSNCDVNNNNMKEGTALAPTCLAAMFSLATRYNNGAQDCMCHTLGSQPGAGCLQYGGKCTCKDGVGGSNKCDQCKLEFYDLTVTGCKPCGCQAVNKICSFTTGQCICPPNVQGQNCDQCVNNHWSLNPVTGCQACNCNITGSLNLQCDPLTGICACKQGVNGDKCNQCLPEYKDFGATGCQGCNCDQSGSTGFLCDGKTGQCPCKTNVAGLRCTDCKAGTFYNDVSHANGCLDCICMGVTTVCQSTTQRLQQHTIPITVEKVEADGTTSQVPNFKLRTNDNLPILAAAVTPGNVMSQAGQETHVALQVLLNQNSVANWFQEEKFSGNLLSLYYNDIEFDVHYTRTDANGVPANIVAILIGLDGTAIRFPLQLVQPDIITTIKLMIREDKVASGTTITRGQLMKQLTKAILLLPATFSTRGHISSLLGVRYLTPSASGFLDRAFGNELCVCGPGYQGMSCEECSYGYRRENVATHPYLGECVGCECNGHAAFCDPVTGACENCQHGTTGFNCERCEDGKYGDATAGTSSDCKVCPCYAPRVINSTCSLITVGLEAGLPKCSFCAPGYTGRLCDQCAVFHYGNPQIQGTGTCTECNCNGNSQQCNGVTGECIACQQQTTGFNCERCMDQWFGNATTQSCGPCTCDMRASTSTICDHVSGQCACLPGVGNRICDQCQPSMYGYSNANIEGCTACNCNDFGSASPQCAETGICTCKPESGGDKCEFCSETLKLWGLPHRACEACDCSDVGTVDPNKACEKVFGQCECKPGVTGRKCDKCERLYSGFSMTGCTKCSDCQYSLGNDTQGLKDEWEIYWNHTENIAKLQEQDDIMQNLSAQISSTSANLGVSEDRLGVLTDKVKILTAAEPANTDAVDNLMDRMNSLQTSASTQDTRAQTQLTRVTEMRGQVDGATAAINQMKLSAPASIVQLTSFNQSAYDLKAVSNSKYSGSISVSFLDQLNQVTAELADQVSTLDAAENMASMVQAQAQLTSDLRTSVVAEQTKATTVSNDLATTDALITTVLVNMAQVDDLLNATLYDKQYAETRFTEATATLSEADTIQSNSKVDFSAGGVVISECIIVIEGTVLPLPVDTTVDLTGVQGWQQAADLLDSHIQTSTKQRTDNQAPILAAEVRAAELTNTAQTLENEFKSVQPLGQKAVDAIADYQSVVDTLSSSVTQANAAQTTMSAVITELNAVSVDTYKALIDQTKVSSEEAAIKSDDFDAIPAELRPKLTAADNAVDASIATWAALETTMTAFSASVDQLSVAVNSDTIAQNSQNVEVTSNSAIQRAETLTAQDAALEPRTVTLENLVAVVQSTLNNASVLQTTIAKDVEAFTDDYEDVQTTVTAIEAEFDITSAKMTTIEAKLAAIEAKVAQARALLVAVEQPVNFRQESDALTMDNPRVTSGMRFNEVAFQFKYAGAPEGLLFFVENSATREKILLQLVNGRLVYEYCNVDVCMTLTSKADLYPSVWFHVLATRYDISIQLTTTRLDTGGKDVIFFRAESTVNNQLTLDSKVHLGGLPIGTSSAKVYPGSTFAGCISDVTFDNNMLPIWQTILHHQYTAQCCAKPPIVPQPEAINAVNFAGLGYMTYNPGTFSVAGVPVHLRFEFRTFGADGTILLVDKGGVDAYFGLFMVGGKVTLNFAINAISVALVSDGTYNNGQWYQLTAMVNTTYAQLYVQSSNSSNANVDMKSRTHTINLSVLDSESKVTFGGQNPITPASRGPAVLPFSGCLRHFQHNTEPDLVLATKDLGGGAIESVAVSLKHCYVDVVEGIGISDQTGYAYLTALVATIQTLSFDFFTYEPNGVMLYMPLQSIGGVSTFCSLSLYNGNIMLLMNQGSGIQAPLFTDNLYLSDGKLHSVTLDFTFTNRPRLTVDTIRYIPLAYLMDPNMILRDRSLYLGGIPDTVVLDSSIEPVKHAVVGGFKNIKINNAAVAYWNPLILPRAQQRWVYLSGLPVATTIPPPPYVVTPAPPTEPPPTCAEPYAFTGTGQGARFGDNQPSYIAFSATSLGDSYETGFSISLDFRALQPSGLIFYMDHSTRTDYLALYLKNGRLEGRMRNNNAGTSTWALTDETYNDGKWWNVVVLKVNNFLALILAGEDPGGKGYKNNNGKTDGTVQLFVDGSIYVGGVPNVFNVPFSEFGIQPVAFQGCLKNMIFTKHLNQEVIFNVDLPVGFVVPNKGLTTIAQPSTSVGVEKCYDSVASGLYMSGDQSYVKLDDKHNINSQFTFEMNFTTTERNGTLMMGYRSQTEFILLDIFQGKIRVSLGAILGEPMSFQSSQEVDSYEVCNGLLQTVRLEMGADNVRLLVNGYKDRSRTFETFPFSPGFLQSYMTGMDLYIGGYPDSSWSVPLEKSKQFWSGCMKVVRVGTTTYTLTASGVKNNVKAGCPFPPVIQ